MCLKNDIFLSECSGNSCLLKNGSSMFLDDNGAKELLIICDHVHFSHKNELTKVTGNDWSVGGLGSY